MANARLIYKTISVSEGVNSLPLPARLLFTWLIPHADDEGRLKGNPIYIKAQVVPMTNWSLRKIESYLKVIKNVGLIHFWIQNNEWFIEFSKWDKYQHIRKDRFSPSSLPSYQDANDNQTSTSVQPYDDKTETEVKLNKTKLSKVKNCEDNGNIADESINDERSYAASHAWKQIEPDNQKAFKTTYLWAIKQGLPTYLVFQFVSEIKQDPSIRNKGAVFQAKVKDWLKRNKEGRDNG